MVINIKPTRVEDCCQFSDAVVIVPKSMSCSFQWGSFGHGFNFLHTDSDCNILAFSAASRPCSWINLARCISIIRPITLYNINKVRITTMAAKIKKYCYTPS
jgi:hypothetical protein